MRTPVWLKNIQECSSLDIFSSWKPTVLLELWSWKAFSSRNTLYFLARRLLSIRFRETINFDPEIKLGQIHLK